MFYRKHLVLGYLVCLIFAAKSTCSLKPNIRHMHLQHPEDSLELLLHLNISIAEVVDSVHPEYEFQV